MHAGFPDSTYIVYIYVYIYKHIYVYTFYMEMYCLWCVESVVHLAKRHSSLGYGECTEATLQQENIKRMNVEVLYCENFIVKY